MSSALSRHSVWLNHLVMTFAILIFSLPVFIDCSVKNC